MIILLIAAGMLAYGAIKFCINFFLIGTIQNRERIIIYGSTLTAALLYGSTINFSPCYNLITSATSYAAMGLVLLSLGRPSDYGMKALHLLTGAILGIAILNKFSAGACVLFLIIIFIVAFNRSNRTRIAQIAVILAGIIITTALFVGAHMMTENVIDEFRFGMAVFKQVQTEPTTARLLRYSAEFTGQLFWSGALLLIPLSMVSVFTKPLYFVHIRNLAFFIALIMGGYHIISAFPLAPSHLIWLIVQSESVTLILVLSLIATAPMWIRDVKTVIFTIGLIILPYCAAIGTGNAIHTQVVISLAPWGTVIGMLAVATKFNGYSNGRAMIICGVFVSIIPVQVILCSLTPYHLNSSIWKQNVSTEIGVIGKIKTDKATHDYVISLTDAMKTCNISNGSPFLGFYDLPGAALVIRGIPVFSPWLSNANQSAVMLSSVDSNLLHNAVIGILLNKDGTMPDLPKQFHDFPTGYKICGEAIYPAFPHQNQHIQIWAPSK